MDKENTLSKQELIEKHGEAYLVQSMMTVHGGSFMQALAQGLGCADMHNQHKIKTAWREDWDRYLDVAVHHYERHGRI